eukprot:TRINITY_DN3692_c0_g1_i1.p3 TRINITY_DN3692_c0_g1~~TRINITY_DN3692_c0_g1_i1.p3  ORF type:complete len:122 (-),score=23.14 TRINITY_DN3692_c0_g1_i1:563-928(-)
MIRRPPRSTLSSSSAASDVYKRQEYGEDQVDHRSHPTPALLSGPHSPRDTFPAAHLCVLPQPPLSNQLVLVGLQSLPAPPMGFELKQRILSSATCQPTILPSRSYHSHDHAQLHPDQRCDR